MEKKNLEIGRTGILVPYLGMGTWAIGGGAAWGNNDDSLSIRTIEEAAEQGIAWFDTAQVYNMGHSEEVVGRAINSIRDKVILSTKCGLVWDHKTPIFHKNMEGFDVYRDLSREGIRGCVEDSLRRLRTDYIDVLYTHWQTTDFKLYPIEETVSVLEELKKEGLIRAYGASNVNAEIVREYCKYGELSVIQEKYSLLDRKICDELVPVCEELGVSIQAYSPLEQGLLTGKVTMDTSYPDGDVRNRNRFFKPENRSKVLKLLENWKPLCEKYSCSMSNLITVCTAHSVPRLHVLCGARKPEQIRDNAKALHLEIAAADLDQMLAELSEEIFE